MNDKHQVLKDNGLLAKGDMKSYEEIMENHIHAFSRLSVFGHNVVTMFPATGNSANVHFHCWFRNSKDELYECIDSYVKNKGKAIKILNNHHKRAFKQPIKI